MSQVREDFFDGFSCGLACRRNPRRLIGGRLIVVGRQSGVRLPCQALLGR
jgi:hypothetical protein